MAVAAADLSTSTDSISFGFRSASRFTIASWLPPMPVAVVREPAPVTELTPNHDADLSGLDLDPEGAVRTGPGHAKPAYLGDSGFREWPPARGSHHLSGHFSALRQSSTGQQQQQRRAHCRDRQEALTHGDTL